LQQLGQFSTSGSGSSSNNIISDTTSSSMRYYTLTGYPVATSAVNDQTGCFLRPCRNGATCIPNGISFLCQCSKGWYGQFCEQPVAISVHDPLNEGIPRLAPLAGGVQPIPGYTYPRPPPGSNATVRYAPAPWIAAIVG
jgi:hypothetical protein